MRKQAREERSQCSTGNLPRQKFSVQANLSRNISNRKTEIPKSVLMTCKSIDLHTAYPPTTDERLLVSLQQQTPVDRPLGNRHHSPRDSFRAAVYMAPVRSRASLPFFVVLSASSTTTVLSSTTPVNQRSQIPAQPATNNQIVLPAQPLSRLFSPMSRAIASTSVLVDSQVGSATVIYSGESGRIFTIMPHVLPPVDGTPRHAVERDSAHHKSSQPQLEDCRGARPNVGRHRILRRHCLLQLGPFGAAHPDGRARVQNVYDRLWC